jgi:hypothetical protein
MAALRSFVPPTIGRFPHGHPLVLIDIFGAFGIVRDKFPGFVFKVVANLFELNSRPGDNDIAARLG